MKILNGLMLVNKSPGMTSHDVVARARRILNTRSIGHCGTLDPLAQGLMVLLVGEATKLSQYILEGNKSYRVGFKLGIRTDTMDITGKVLEEKAVDVDPKTVEREALRFEGEFNLNVPIFSAVKVQGQKLYEYARNDEEVKIPQKLMKFWDVRLVSQAHPEWQFDLTCSKGSYIRTWVDELGKNLGCGSVMTSLERSFSAPYYLKQAQTLEQIQMQIGSGGMPTAFIPITEALPWIKKVRISGADQKLLGNGQISHDLRVTLIRIFDPQIDQIVQIVSRDHGHLLALIGLDEGKGFTIRRVLNS